MRCHVRMSTYRLLPLAGIAVLAGTALQLQQRELWFAGWVWVEVVLALAIWLLALLLLRRRAKQVGPALVGCAAGIARGVAVGIRPELIAVSMAVLAGGLLLGHAQAEWRAQARLADRLTAELEGVDLVVAAFIIFG